MSSDQPPERIYRFAEYQLMPVDRMLVRGDVRIPMPPRVFNLLLVLVENAGRLVTKETLMNEIWEDSFVEEGNLNQTVSRLRKILGEKANENQFIETIPRVGYRFIAGVETVGGSSRATTGEQAPANSEAPTSPPSRRSFSRWLLLIPVALIAIGGTALWLFTSRTDTEASAEASNDSPQRLTNNRTREDRPVFTHEGDIRFARWQGALPVTFVMGADGSNQRRDTSIPGLRTGSWSPDGKKVFFHKEGDDAGSIYLANSDGSNETKLPFLAGNMDWSPDSGKIIYQFGKENSDIYLYTLSTGAVATLVAAPAFDSDPSFAPDGKSFLFVSDRDGNAEIYRQNLDGSNLKRLTNHPAHDAFPTFSPDGTKIAFNSNREDENVDVYFMNPDGSAIRRLTNWKSEEEIRPGCWSADGTEIIFLSNKDGIDNVYKMNAEALLPAAVVADSAKNLGTPVYSPDGKRLLYVAEADDKSGELHSLEIETKKDTLLLKTETAETFPRFSPDGGSIVFQNRTGGNAEICVMNSDGADIRDLTNNPARDANPAWSPDGSKIVFVSNREGNFDVFSLYVMNADGSNQHRIYYSYAISGYPSWSPDGSQIVFANDKEEGRSGNFEIFSIEPETVNAERRLTFRPRYDTQPVFSPDGKRIAFVSNTDGNGEIYVMNADGSSLQRITRNRADDTSPAWSPDGRRIIFSSNRSSGKFAIYELTLDDR